MAPRMLIASTNQGKLREFYALVPEGVELVTLADFGLNAPEETGVTFAENADLKALAGARASGLIALADDSGLEVDALAGAPGVYSARYAGEPVSDERNVELLLANMRDRDVRSAHFTCAISIASPEGILARSEGRCEGAIADAPRGSHGFGYDPVFLMRDGRTLAEYEPEEKNQLSHRSRAIRSIAPKLRSILEQLRTNQQ